MTGALFLWFALAICSYSILRPVRGALIMSDFGPGALPWVYIGTALITGVSAWVYNRFTHLPRRVLFGRFLLFFAANLAGWWLAARAGGAWVSPAFYVWTDVFSIMNVTVFWTYANDVIPPQQARRAFGVVSAAGSVGGIAGSGLTKLLVERVGAIDMLAIAAAIYALIWLVFQFCESQAAGRSAAGRKPVLDGDKTQGVETLRDVVRAIGASRVLLLLTVVVAFERMVPDFVDFVFNSVIHSRYPTRESYASFFAGFELARSVAASAAALLLARPVLTQLGAHAGLVSVPATIALLSLGFAWAPVVGMAIALKGLEEGQRHSWFKAGKELVYTATDPAVIYRVKSYVEMFVYRLARGVAGLMLIGLTAGLGLGPVGVALAAVPLAALWAKAAWDLGRAFEDSQRR